MINDLSLQNDEGSKPTFSSYYHYYVHYYYQLKLKMQYIFIVPSSIYCKELNFPFVSHIANILHFTSANQTPLYYAAIKNS